MKIDGTLSRTIAIIIPRQRLVAAGKTRPGIVAWPRCQLDGNRRCIPEGNDGECRHGHRNCQRSLVGVRWENSRGGTAAESDDIMTAWLENQRDIAGSQPRSASATPKPGWGICWTGQPMD